MTTDPLLPAPAGAMDSTLEPQQQVHASDTPTASIPQPGSAPRIPRRKGLYYAAWALRRFRRERAAVKPARLAPMVLAEGP